MNAFRAGALLLVAVLGADLFAQDFAAVKVVADDAAKAFVITAPGSQLTLTVPKAKLKPGVPAPGTQPNYFVLEEEGRALLVSGWFEPADRFAGIREFWAQESASLKQSGLPELRNVAFEQLGSWSAVFYDVVIPEIPGAVSANVRAHWVEAGTWIDTHLSLTTFAADKPRDDLKKVLKGLTVTAKKRP